ncbi:unnamed protein product [Lymnaea stagnalis]|uniref:Interference hedgehog n=1 Tax=Lymnaea stagnalis TaxID=6523 RepID=A0AAV2IFQ0_LYMST
MPGMRRHVQVALGADVSLECPSYGHPDANITWSKLGGSLPIGRFNISDLGFIHIESVQYEDTGTYRCSGSGYLGEGGTDQVTLEVHTPPVVQVVRQPGKVVLVGDRVELVCSYGGLPKPSLTWYHNGRELASDNEGSLVLAKVTTADSGIYQCMATNILGTKYGILSLKVSSQLRVQPKATEKVITSDKKPAKPSEDEKDNTQRKKNVRRDRKKNGRRKKPSMRDKRKKKKNGVGAQADAEKPKYAPSVPTVTQLSDRSVMLNWSVPDKGNGQTIKFFKVQFKEMHPEKGPWQTSDAHLTYDIRRFEVANLKVGASYKFRVLAVYEDDDNKNSANTNIFKLKVEPHAQARPPDSPPMIVEATPVVYQENYGIGVKWQYKAESASPIEGFIIFYKPFGSEEEDTEKRVLGAGIRSEVIRDLMANTDYRIQIRSFNMAGQSQFSNLVVKRTKPRGVTTVPDFGPGDLVPEIERSTDAPIGDRRSSETLEQPVILGIVLGALLLALFVLVTMCWWKQRQQKRRNLCNNQQQKFQDQSRCIFADTTHSKPNGGLYPANGSIPVANGHGPPHESHGHMNIDVNPLAEYDVQTNVHGDGRPKQFYGNGMNGNLARCNGEKTCSEVSCQHVGSNHMGCNGELAYMEHQKATYPMQHRTLPLTPNQPLHSFYTEAGSLGRPLNHEYSEPGDHELIHSSGIPHALYNKQNLVHSGGHHGQVRNFDYSWSRAYDQPRLDKASHVSMDRISSCYPAVVDFGVNAYPHQQKRLGTPSPTAHLPAQNFATVPGGLGCNMGNAMHGGKHKRRRKRPNSRDQVLREHAMKDQATNTDLSSNEGTFDFNNYCKSGSSSGSDICGRNCDSSFANNGSLESMDDDSHSAVSSASHGSEPRLAANGLVSL